MAEFKQSTKLHNVLYDIRGPILQAAQQMEAEGHRILKLNIGNPAPFGFEAPDAILVDMIRHLPHAQGYSDSRGIFSARTAVSQYYQTRGIQNIHVDDIYLGNGVSELITMSLMALLDDGDEVLIPTPGLPAVDRLRGPGRRQARALPLRRGVRLAARPRGPGSQDHARAPRALW